MKNNFFNKKNKAFVAILLILFLLIIVFICFYLNTHKKDEENKTAINFEETIKNIDLSHKRIFLQEREKDQTNIIEISSKSLSLWEDFVDSYKEKQPEEYKRTKGWDKKITQILRHERKAVELAKEGKPDAAREEIIKSNNIFKAIKKENNILDISDEILALYDEVSLVAEMTGELRSQINMPDLKFKYTKLKEYGLDERYRQLFSEMEESIAQLDKGSQENDIQKGQESLKNLIIEAYLNY